MKLKIGDKVACYWASETTSLERCTGEVTNINGDLIETKIIDDGNYGVLFKPGDKATWHVKQCRKLVRKERRRVWVSINDNTNMPMRVCYAPDSMKNIDESWIEFIEVKK